MADPKNYTLLVVDDENGLRDTLVFALQQIGFKVLSAENGKKGFEVIKANKVNLVISDVRMPEVDGIQLLEQIRKSNPAGLPYVILMTGFADISEEACLAKGAKGVLRKPFSRKTLMGLVMKFLEEPEQKKAA